MVGDIRLGETVDIKFCTRNAGVPTTLAGSPVISAYVNNGTTEITAGITLSVDFDGRTGYHNVRVVASGANGFTSASNVSLVITTGTVGGISVVGMEVESFSIECRSALMPATAARTLVVDAAGLADANTVKIGPSGSGTAQTAGDLPGRLTATRAGYLDNLSAGAVALEASLQGLITTIGASAAGVATAVWSAATRLLTAGTNIVLAKGTGVTGFNDPTANQNADALLDRADAVETGLTVRGSFRLALAALAGKLSGADTSTTTIRNAVADSKDRIVANTDATGRTSVTTDVS